ncbi:hypothetical protein, conserved [Plasmodium gonderi]|uniref:Uncharacterized protein n=1 Tax=Plasmodium gonderi TaxID=77519 RepID=A0A1Y1JAY9_PLAGO|nr:hypothetical protein, conserved [Plasmodium gonderi]GAW79656.1 hypothetical protein, conserved [Plasmodium gonderi]
MTLNKVLNELLEKWEGKKINLYNVCICFHHIKQDVFLKWRDRRDFLLNDLNLDTFRKFMNLLDREQSEIIASSIEDKYFFLIFVTFIFNTENDFLRRNYILAKQVEEKYSRVYTQMKIKNKSKQEGREKNKDKGINVTTENVEQKSNKEKKKHLLNKQVEEEMANSNDQLNQLNNVFENFDILIKRVVDLKINNNSCQENEFLKCKMYVFYSFLKFLFILSNDCPEIRKHYLKHLKNILLIILSIKLGMLINSDYIVHLANATLLLIVCINFNVVKDYEKEFLNFLTMQLNRKKYCLQTVEQILVTYLQKKKNIILNNEIYENLNNYIGDNINLFLKYGKKENLFFFFNLLHIFNSLLNCRISNTNQSVYFVKHVECVNINVSIKEIIANIQKLLTYLGNMSKDYLSYKKMDISLDGGPYTYHNDEQSNDLFSIEQILKEEERRKKDPNEIFRGSPTITNNSVSNNIFTYIIDNVFSFFRILIKEQDTESISMNTHIFVNFLKFFHINNNESDLFLTNFMGANFITYCKELLEKCPCTLNELVNYIMHIFRIVNLLTKNRFQLGEGKLFSILRRIKEVQIGESGESEKRGKNEKNRERYEMGKGMNLTEPIHALYNNSLSVLGVFLKNVENYAHEQVKEKILTHYEHFLFHTLDDESNVNFHIIFQNSTSIYLTLKVLSNLMKIHKFDFENIYNFYFKLTKMETEVIQVSQQGASFYYKNELHSNTTLVRKIKTFILTNLDLISLDVRGKSINVGGDKSKKLEQLDKLINLKKSETAYQFEPPITGKSVNILKDKQELKHNQKNLQMDEKHINIPMEEKEKNKRAREEMNMQDEELFNDESCARKKSEYECISSPKDLDEQLNNAKMPGLKKGKFYSHKNQYKIKKKEKKINNPEEMDSADYNVQDMGERISSFQKGKYLECENICKDGTVQKRQNNEDGENGEIQEGAKMEHTSDMINDTSIINNEGNQNNSVLNCTEELDQWNINQGESATKKRKTKTLENADHSRSSHVENSSSNLKELTDNIKKVSSSDALDSLKYMKQSILNDL